MAHHVSARYDENDGTFLPPLRTLGFNPQLKMNDSLLIQSYIEAYDISYPEAQRRIEAEVAELRQHLETEGHYELTDIGDLHLNEEGHLEFEPCEAGILTPALYGLSSFEMAPLQTTAEEKSTGTPANTPETVEKPTHHERAITIKMSWLRNAVAVVAAVVAFLLIGTPVSNSNLSETTVQQSAFVPLPSTTKAEPAGNPVHGANADKAAAVADNQTAQAPQTADDYRLVLASQVTLRNAEAFISLLSRDGFAEAQLYQNKNMLRVVYGHYATEAEAFSVLYQLRTQSSYFKEAWVLKIEN